VYNLSLHYTSTVNQSVASEVHSVPKRVSGLTSAKLKKLIQD